jgi:hypothetical protein
MMILPAPNRPRPLPDPGSLPIFSALLDNPRFGRAAQRMADRLGCHTVEVTAGLLHFFAVIEGNDASR